jgi:hypothetical protein
VLRLLFGLLVALAGAFSASTAATGAATTAASAATYTYDSPLSARVDADAFGAAEVNPTESIDALEESALPLVEAPRTPTTPSATGVATNTADDAARFVVDSAGNTTLRAQGPSGWIDVTSHAARRMTQRGISIDDVDLNVPRNPGRRCCLWVCSPRTRRHLATVTPLRAPQPLMSRAERRRLGRDQQRRRNA